MELERAREAARQHEARIAALVAEHNTRLLMREAELRREVETPRLVLQRLLRSRSWRTMQAVIARVQRLRGVPHIPPAMPPLGALSIPRLDLAGLGRGGEAPAPAAAPAAPARPASRPAQAARTAPAGPPALVLAETLHRGGLEQVVVDLAMGLNELGQAVMVGVTDTGGDSAEMLRQAGIEVREFGKEPGRFAAFVAQRRPAFALANHTYFGLSTLGEAGVPVVEVVHNYYTWHERSANG
jgi:hypothetical protein